MSKTTRREAGLSKEKGAAWPRALTALLPTVLVLSRLFLLVTSFGLHATAQGQDTTISQSLDRVARLRLSGKPAMAVQQLQQLELELGPDNFRRNHLGYLKAVLLREDDQQEAACTLFRDAVDSFPLRENLLLHLFECYPIAQRRPLYEEFLKAAGHPKHTQILFQFAELLQETGDLAESKKRYDQVWRARGALWREAALEHARLHILEGDEASAVKDLENLIARRERGAVAHQTVIDLERLQAGTNLSEARLRKRVQIYMNQRDTEPARRLLQELIERFPKSASIDQYLYQVGRSYVLDEDYRTAIKSYETAYRHSPSEAWGVRSKYLVANTALRINDFELAKTTYEYVIKEHPTNRYAVDARYNLADTYRWLGDLEAAEDSAKDGLKAVSAVDKRRFYYFLSRLYLEEKRFQESLTQLARLERFSSRHLPSGVTSQEIFYLKGLNLLDLEQRDSAQVAFRTAARKGSDYFAKMANAELEALPPEGSPDDQQWLDRLLDGREFWGDESPPSRLASRRDRVRELLFLRLYDEAAIEIRWGGSALFQKRRTDYLFNRAYYTALGGLAEESLTAAELLERTAFSRTQFKDYPRLIQTLLFPRHFSTAIRSVSGDYGVESDLVLAVMKQESRFETDAFSPATARGLMQFMVPTAESLARELGLEFSDAAQLFEPDLSIRLGGFYLSKLLNQFQGSPEKALAAYNGGADNAARWDQKLTWPRADLFVSNIGFRETKLYVLKVMGNYFTYRSLYSERPGADLESQWLAWFRE